MSQRMEIFVQDGLKYRWRQEKDGRREAVLVGVESGRKQAVIPESVEGWPVTGIDRKALLSSKVREVVLPHTIREIGDWAFAYSTALVRVSLPARQLQIGKDVFLHCKELKEIYCVEEGLKEPEAGQDMAKQSAVLLAAAVTVLKAPYLLEPSRAGSEEWLAKWDARLRVIIETDDQEGYVNQVLCGEEDYGSTDPIAFENNRRKEKVRLAFLRLLNPAGLSENLREELSEYLRTHTRGCESEETWEVVLEEYGEERSVFELFALLGCVTQENLPDILAQIGEEKTEMKAYFLRYQEEHFERQDFFDSLSLDF